MHVTVVDLWPRTGRTHQLRKHMAYLGHPILGDKKYWGARKVSESELTGHVVVLEECALAASSEREAVVLRGHDADCTLCGDDSAGALHQPSNSIHDISSKGKDAAVKSEDRQQERVSARTTGTGAIHVTKPAKVEVDDVENGQVCFYVLQLREYEHSVTDISGCRIRHRGERNCIPSGWILQDVLLPSFILQSAIRLAHIQLVHDVRTVVCRPARQQDTRKKHLGRRGTWP